ncbi:hypothetical protein D3C87_1266110 [compost metagenome]
MLIEVQNKGWAQKIYDECMADQRTRDPIMGVRLLYGDGSLAGVVDVDKRKWDILQEDVRRELCDQLVRDMTLKRSGLNLS